MGARASFRGRVSVFGGEFCAREERREMNDKVDNIMREIERL